jgi:Fur family zinc uptake transcriptional regulator
MKKSNQEIILEVLSKSSKPMTAYQILSELKEHGINGPPTVYRALEALQEKGQVHRIESLNAFIVCHHLEHKSPASFVMCKTCGDVDEILDERMESLLKELTDEKHFSVSHQTIELSGFCHQCKKLDQ